MPVSGALIDGRAVAAGSRPAVDGSPTAGGAVGGRGGAAGRRGGRRRGGGHGLAQDQPGPARFDLELGQVGPLEQLGQPVDQGEQLDIAAVARLGRPGSRPRRRSSAGDREDERRVLAAEPERVAQRGADLVGRPRRSGSGRGRPPRGPGRRG